MPAVKSHDDPVDARLSHGICDAHFDGTEARLFDPGAPSRQGIAPTTEPGLNIWCRHGQQALQEDRSHVYLDTSILQSIQPPCPIKPLVEGIPRQLNQANLKLPDSEFEIFW
jgi:hypothetical protein